MNVTMIMACEWAAPAECLRQGREETRIVTIPYYRRMEHDESSATNDIKSVRFELCKG